MKKRVAFTLAEVLITLGIIGVVAAMTIPTLLQRNYERRTVAQLKETYSIVSQAIRMAEEEYGEVEGWGITGKDEASALIIAEKLKPFLKLALDCGVNDVGGKCVVDVPYKYLASGQTNASYASQVEYYKMVLLNGTTVILRGIAESGNPGAYSGYFFVFVDTNGKTKPNTWGKDFFEFTYERENKFLRPTGAPDSYAPYSEKCTKESTGGGCAYYLLHFGNMNYLH